MTGIRLGFDWHVYSSTSVHLFRTGQGHSEQRVLLQMVSYYKQNSETILSYCSCSLCEFSLLTVCLNCKYKHRNSVPRDVQRRPVTWNKNLICTKPIAVVIILKHLIVVGVKYVQVVILGRGERLYKVTLKILHMHHGDVTGRYSWITGRVQKFSADRSDAQQTMYRWKLPLLIQYWPEVGDLSRPGGHVTRGILQREESCCKQTS